MQHHIPLAERMRPRSFSDVAGQSHLLGEGMPLAQVFATGRLHSMVLWGPPGVGKTTLARLIAQRADLPFVALSAVLAGVKDIRDTVAQAQAVWNSPLATLNHAPQPTVVFVDEVHRFNKSQQDAFLPFVESGLFIFIGATTENPSFEVNSALLSRAAVYMLKPLEAAECATLLHRAVAQVAPHISLSEQAQTLVIASADGDARKLLNHLEAVLDLAVTPQTALAENPEPVTIKAEQVAKVLSQNMRRFDKGGDAFYDQISALHKSVRGSDRKKRRK